jgi:hypothetical protein
MLSVYILYLMASAGFSGPYSVRFVAFDGQGSPLYMREAVVFLGKPEQLGSRPLPPPGEIQDVDISLRVTTVPEGERCAFPQTATTEIGRQIYFGCKP